MNHPDIPSVDGDITPGEAARAVYEAGHPHVPWREVRELHQIREGAWFVETSRVCVAARLVGSWWSEEQILEPGYVDPNGDELHVWVAVGNLGTLLRRIPPAVMEQVRTISFQRYGGELRRYRLARLTGFAMRQQTGGGGGCRHGKRKKNARTSSPSPSGSRQQRGRQGKL